MIYGFHFLRSSFSFHFYKQKLSMFLKATEIFYLSPNSMMYRTDFSESYKRTESWCSFPAQCRNPPAALLLGVAVQPLLGLLPDPALTHRAHLMFKQPN